MNGKIEHIIHMNKIVDFHIKHLPIKRISNYQGYGKKMKFQCLKYSAHGTFWHKPCHWNFIKCPKCKQMRKDARVDKKLRGTGIKRITHYYGTSKRTTFLCLKNPKHGTWKVCAGSVLYEHHGCPKCAKEKILKFGLNKHKNKHYWSNKSIDKALKHKRIKRMSNYKGINSPMTFLCLKNPKHGTWTVNAQNVLKYHRGCPKCRHVTPNYNNTSKRARYRYVTVKNKMVDTFLQNTPIKRLSNYNSYRTKLKLICVKHHVTWYESYNALRHFKIEHHTILCPVGRKTIYWNKIVDSILNGTSVERVSSCYGSHGPIYLKCLRNKEHPLWIAYPCRVEQSIPVCPCCNASLGESQCSIELKHLGFKQLKCLNMYKNNVFSYSNSVHYKHHTLSIDFLLTYQHNQYAIEVDGAQHNWPIGYFGGIKSWHKRIYHDYWKDKWCFQHHILMIRVKSYKTRNRTLKKSLFMQNLKYAIYRSISKNSSYYRLRAMKIYKQYFHHKLERYNKIAKNIFSQKKVQQLKLF